VSDVARGFPDQAGALQVHTHRAAPAEVKHRADVEVYLRRSIKGADIEADVTSCANVAVT
jgi:hypothetical protein